MLCALYCCIITISDDKVLAKQKKVVDIIFIKRCVAFVVVYNHFKTVLLVSKNAIFWQFCCKRGINKVFPPLNFIGINLFSNLILTQGRLKGRVSLHSFFLWSSRSLSFSEHWVGHLLDLMSSSDKDHFHKSITANELIQSDF